MAITSLDSYIASTKQIISLGKISTITTAAGLPYTDILAKGCVYNTSQSIGNSTSGIIPVSGTIGYPFISTVAGTPKYYITRAEYNSSVSATVNLYQCVYAVGTITNSAGTTTLASQPNYLSALPTGSYSNLQLWYEQTTATAGITSLIIDYQNESDVTSSAAISIPASTPVARLIQIPLVPGDLGISKINSITRSGATSGAFNLRILRPLFSQSCWSGGSVINMDISQTGMPEIYPSSALYTVITAGSTLSPISIHNIEIAAL